MRVTVKEFSETWLIAAFHHAFAEAVAKQNVHHTGSAGYWDEPLLHNIAKSAWYQTMPKPQKGIQVPP